MDDILLILLGIFWAIISIYQSQRKKKKKAERLAATRKNNNAAEQSYDSSQASQVASENKDFLDKIFDAFDENSADDPYESFAEEMIEEEEIEDPDAKPKTMSEKSLEEISEQEGGSFLTETSTSSRLRKRKSTKKNDWVRNIARDFDGKKAVIYSEILNRPYS